MRLFVGFLFFSIFFVVSCIDDSVYFSESKSIKNPWVKDTLVEYDFTIEDTAKSYNIYTIVRNNNNYPYRNIIFFISLKDRFGIVRKDTLEYEIANPTGEWRGKGIGDLKENLLVYTDGYKFPFSGDYSIKINQAMRDKNLVGIEDISLIIEMNDAK